MSRIVSQSDSLPKKKKNPWDKSTGKKNIYVTVYKEDAYLEKPRELTETPTQISRVTGYKNFI